MNDKKLIVNGRLNPSLTDEELLSLEGESLKEATWYMMVSIRSGDHPFRNDVHPINPRIYRMCYERTDVPSYIYEELHIDTLAKLQTLLDARKNLKSQYTREMWLIEHKQGRDIYNSQKELNFSGRFNLTVEQLCGFISARGSWNDFQVGDVIRAVRKLDEKAPRYQYGVNNPNTGFKGHQWQIEGDYIFLVSPYLGDDKAKEAWAIFFSTFEVMFEGAKADSIQSKKINNGVTDCGFEFYAWWD